MAASCCVAATSTRFVASSSCRARKTRTLAGVTNSRAGAHYSSSSSGATSSISINIHSSTHGTLGRASPGWAVQLSPPPTHSSSRSSPVSLRRLFSSDFLRSPHRHCSRTLAPAAADPVEVVFEKSLSTSGRPCLEYLRRHKYISSWEDAQAYQSSSRRQLSAMLAFALCFVASGSTTATTTSNQEHDTSSSSEPRLAKLNTDGSARSASTPTVSKKPGKTKPTFMFSKLQAEKDVNKLQEGASKNQYLVSEGIFQGARWTMEDTYKVENGGRFVAVFDGHGGADVSTILKERLYELYSEELVKKHWEQQNEFGMERKEVPSKSCHIAALQRGLEQVEEAIMKLDDLVYQGSTAVCVVLHVKEDGRRTLLTANVGDSRAILCRDGKAVDLTRDHKPNDEVERKRIQAMGEEIEWDPYGQIYRVRDLSLSRAIGDRFAKPVVSSEAEIMTFPVNEEGDQYVLLASDGLWDVMSSQEVVDYVQEIINTESKVFSQLDKRKEIARIVANEALERGSADNVCVIVVWLKDGDL